MGSTAIRACCPESFRGCPPFPAHSRAPCDSRITVSMREIFRENLTPNRAYK
jgi:hypothetical protein